jgi:hypothetical protein
MPAPVTLHVLRVVAVLHSLAFLVQPVFAGRYAQWMKDSETAGSRS